MPLLATGSSLTMREPRLVNTETHIEARLQTEFTGAAPCWKDLKTLDSSLAKSGNDWLWIFREINVRFSVSFVALFPGKWRQRDEGNREWSGSEATAVRKWVGRLFSINMALQCQFSERHSKTRFETCSGIVAKRSVYLLQTFMPAVFSEHLMKYGHANFWTDNTEDKARDTKRRSHHIIMPLSKHCWVDPVRRWDNSNNSDSIP